MLSLTYRHRFSPSIRRLSAIDRQFSQTSSSSSSSSLQLITASNIDAGRRKDSVFGSYTRWISVIAAGSSLGLLYWFSISESDSATGFFKKRLLSFCDSPSAVAESTGDDDSRSKTGFQKLSLPDYNSKFIFGDAFRRKVFFKYEKRIRLRSPPEKVFEYFASSWTAEGELLMQPADLMRAVIPVFPPSESNAVREGYLIGERRPGQLQCPPSKFFMLFDVNNDGRISFKEYIFFVTLLSIPESSFSVAFKMFDTDNSGEIDKEEFKKVMAFMRAYNRQGAVHKDGLRTGLKVSGSVDDGGLVELFFGKDGKARLQYDKFIQFMRDLQDEVLRLEFAHYDCKNQGTISAKDFALSMVASADMSHLDKLIDRVEELNNKPHLKDIRITFEEFKNFAELRRKLQPFSLALFSYGKVNGQLTKEDFQRAAFHVCGVSLTDNVVEIIFDVFDSNLDGTLSADEFLRVMHKRIKDVTQPVESGISGFLHNCSIGRFFS
ncbi:hypothetical protein SLEP1_g15566 [Rubroshorea leprosula]|uniref:EF-hand domain-containing protein n=1 Tax=Rubroshorea leprosula TaxID=152421 RepID=A0AAV5IX76_9ROSI|nr:hypothetical protein SLEP1_g15566 [Rubroshorea leprosula]